MVIKAVYKVLLATLKNDRVQYRSCLGNLLGHWGMEYTPKTRILPFMQSSYLYAFDSRESAEKFLKGDSQGCEADSRLHLWSARAEVLNVDPRQTRFDLPFFWDNQLYASEIPGYSITCPEGSVWCEYLELVEIISGTNPPRSEENAGRKQQATSRVGRSGSVMPVRAGGSPSMGRPDWTDRKHLAKR
jgi:hypothetical protein